MTNSDIDNLTPEVAVLMATYNGEKFLSEQLDSILNQSYKNINLIVRDDGSTDSTYNILNNYADKLTIIKGHNVGCKACFSEVAKYAAINYSNCKYFAFSDQDDFWLQDKIKTAVKKLEHTNVEDRPLLYICPTKLVDEKLNPITHKYSKKSFRYTLEEAMMLGTCAGCTMVFNRKLLDLYVKASPDVMYLHDDWIYKVCLACNGTLIVDDQPHILYRQHGHNVLGGNQGKLKAWTRRFKMFKEGRVRSSKAKYILDIYSDEISDHAKNILTDVANYTSSIKCKLHLLFSDKFRTTNRKFNLLFKIAVICNKF